MARDEASLGMRLVFAVTLVASLGVQAQKPAGDPKPAGGAAPKDAAEVIDTMRTTLLGAKSVSFHTKFTSGFGPIVALGADLQATVRRSDDGAMTGLRMTGKFLPGGPNFDAASDGTRVRAIDRDAKIYEDGPFSADAMAMQPPGMGGGLPMLLWAFPVEFLQTKDLAIQEGDTAQLKPPVTMDGVLCDVVEVARKVEIKGIPPHTTIYIYTVGRGDHLLRKMSRENVTSEPGSLRSPIPREFNQWKVNPAVDDATFTLDVSGLKEGEFRVKGPGSGGMDGPPGGMPAGLGKSGPSFGLKAGDKPSDFALKDTSGKEQKLAAYAKKTLIVCFTEASDASAEGFVGKLKAKVGDKASLLELVVDHGSPPDTKRMKTPAWPRCLSADGVDDAWSINLFPMLVVIGGDGKVVTSMPTGLSGGVPVDTVIEGFTKKLNAYLKNPAKGW